MFRPYEFGFLGFRLDGLGFRIWGHLGFLVVGVQGLGFSGSGVWELLKFRVRVPDMLSLWQTKPREHSPDSFCLLPT